MSLNKTIKFFLISLFSISFSFLYLFNLLPWLVDLGQGEQGEQGELVSGSANQTSHYKEHEESEKEVGEEEAGETVEGLPDTVSEETLSELTKRLGPGECFKKVPSFQVPFGNKTENRCGFYLVIAEAMKSGTSNLWYSLLENPIFRGTASPKTRCDYLPKVPYTQCLAKIPASYRVYPGQPRVLIDKGPNGHRCESLMTAMRQYAPDIKIVLLFRHPVDRLHSHWYHEYQQWPETIGTFEEFYQPKALSVQRCYNSTIGSFLPCFKSGQFCKNGLDHITRSSYMDLIDLYEAHYSRDQIYVMISEEFFKDTRKELNKLMKWLDLPGQKFHPLMEEQANRRFYEPLSPIRRQEIWDAFFEKGVRRLEDYLGRKLPWKP